MSASAAKVRQAAARRDVVGEPASAGGDREHGGSADELHRDDRDDERRRAQHALDRDAGEGPQRSVRRSDGPVQKRRRDVVQLDERALRRYVWVQVVNEREARVADVRIDVGRKRGRGEDGDYDHESARASRAIRAMGTAAAAMQFASRPR